MIIFSGGRRLLIRVDYLDIVFKSDFDDFVVSEISINGGVLVMFVNDVCFIGFCVVKLVLVFFVC